MRVEPQTGVASAIPTAVDAVVTHHRDGFRSGVARFNELLAAHLGVPLRGLNELDATSRPLLSFKVRELDPAAEAGLEAWLAEAVTWELFLHEYADLGLERRLVDGAARVHSGNHEIAAVLTARMTPCRTLWTPGLLLDDRRFPTTEISVFSFGMAHKLRTDMFRRLRELLEASARSYAVYVSAANHETAHLRDAAVVFEEAHAIFPDELYFLGNLSDVAVADWLRRTTFFAAFFERGVRANNTSVAAAMERGSVVLTNLDEHSPPDLVHGENVLDLGRLDELPVDGQVLQAMAAAASATARRRGWDELVAALRS